MTGDPRIPHHLGFEPVRSGCSSQHDQISTLLWSMQPRRPLSRSKPLGAPAKKEDVMPASVFLSTRNFVAYLLFVAAAAPLCLFGQIHGGRVMSGPSRARPARAGPVFGPRAPVTVSRGHGLARSRAFHPVFATRRLPFRHHRHFNFFLANACFIDPFFDPFLCRGFFLRNSLFLEPLSRLHGTIV